MSTAHMVAATVAFTALLWVPYTLERMRALGVFAVLGNPSPDEPPMVPWARRAAAAHRNAVENLVLFGPAIGVAAAMGKLDEPLVAGAALAYLIARVSHAAVYIAGVPFLRTITFAGGWAATLAVLAGALL